MSTIQKFGVVLSRNSAALVKIGNISKAIFFLGIGVWSAVDTGPEGAAAYSDTTWFYLLELPLIIAATTVMFMWPSARATSGGESVRQNRLRLGVLAVDLVLAMALGITSSFFFVNYVDDLNNSVCSSESESNGTTMCVNGDFAKMRISRTVIYMLFQLLSVHPLVSFIVENCRLESAQT